MFSVLQHYPWDNLSTWVYYETAGWYVLQKHTSLSFSQSSEAVKVLSQCLEVMEIRMRRVFDSTLPNWVVLDFGSSGSQNGKLSIFASKQGWTPLFKLNAQIECPPGIPVAAQRAGGSCGRKIFAQICLVCKTYLDQEACLLSLCPSHFRSKLLCMLYMGLSLKAIWKQQMGKNVALLVVMGTCPCNIII